MERWAILAVLSNAVCKDGLTLGTGALPAPALPLMCCYINATAGTDHSESLNAYATEAIDFDLFACNMKVYVCRIGLCFVLHLGDFRM